MTTKKRTNKRPAAKKRVARKVAKNPAGKPEKPTSAALRAQIEQAHQADIQACINHIQGALQQYGCRLVPRPMIADGLITADVVVQKGE